MSIRRNEVGIVQAKDLAREQIYQRNAKATGILFNEESLILIFGHIMF